MYETYNFSDLVGKTLESVWEVDDERLYFKVNDDETYMLWHSQDCCERVYIESIVGDLTDLVGSPILIAEESGSSYGYGDLPGEDEADMKPLSDYEESWTWTFYKLSTIKGSVTIRWYGSSNGYYSERVDFTRVN